MAATPPQVAKAKLYSLQNNSAYLVVHFNPATLVYSVENSTPQQSGDTKKRQFAAQFTGKLTMDLIFDTTYNGDDVRNYTSTVAAFMQPPGTSTQAPSGPAPATNPDSPPKAQPVVAFEWGVYIFKGVMESFRETIDFFSAEGVPLRSVVSIGLARQDQVLSTDPSGASTHVQGSLIPTSSGGSAQKMADLGGSSGAARQLASDNNLDSLRFTGGASLQVSAGVQLNAAAGFAVGASAGGGLGLSLGGGAGAGVSGGAGVGISGGAGFSVGASAGASASAGAGFSVGASVSAGAASGATFGSSASLGVPATMGAFAGLQTGRASVSSSALLDPTRMLQATSGADIATFSGASFSLGGAANNSSGAGLSANVGATFSFRSRLTFDNDD